MASSLGPWPASPFFFLLLLFLFGGGGLSSGVQLGGEFRASEAQAPHPLPLSKEWFHPMKICLQVINELEL